MTTIRSKIAAFAVHLLTASGILCGFVALQYAMNGAWTESFIWLGVALILDGIDGPLARWIDVEATLPRFSGKQLDLIVDYFSYVAIPAVIINLSPLLAADVRFFASALILMTSLYHFTDQNSKSSDGFFIGFPAVWNVVVFYMFVFKPGPEMALAIIIGLSLATFVPLHWLHPVRAMKFRNFNLMISVLWLGAAAATLIADFSPPIFVKAMLIFTGFYVIALSLLRSFAPKYFQN